MSFAAGQYRPPPDISLATKSSVFEYDPSFQDPRSPLTSEKWRGLFPKREGFFTHPTIAPKRSALAVFHQLHCLNSIRKGYWELYDITSSNQTFPGDDNLPEMSAPAHMQHCIELLRHALMCQPDLTVELKKDGGVTGFGTEHKCKSWDDLTRWTAQWESYGLTSS
ncbi:hypothetical protein N7456_008601 [Penicillium angulare]|uniref:Oxidase ustYa n=1 Tax=Penicillium angulare TaxID=116970 RepID=A0A9W9F3C3_9EURO|nr:hypothetical protein N7456_008601 [Penicillium angulare]